jgi:hypothetical protein
MLLTLRVGDPGLSAAMAKQSTLNMK